MTSCPRCGGDVRFATVNGTRMALDATAQMRPPHRPDLTLYRLRSEEMAEAEPMSGGRLDMQGYPKHEEICPALERERRP